MAIVISPLVLKVLPVPDLVQIITQYVPYNGKCSRCKSKTKSYLSSIYNPFFPEKPCLICGEMICISCQWNCSHCFQFFHLGCIQTLYIDSRCDFQRQHAQKQKWCGLTLCKPTSVYTCVSCQKTLCVCDDRTHAYLKGSPPLTSRPFCDNCDDLEYSKSFFGP